MMLKPNDLTELSKLPQEEIDRLNMNFSEMTFFTGGSVFNAVNTNEILAKTGVKAIIQGYGSTESGIIAMDEAEDFVPGSTRRVAPNVQAKVKRKRF